ncbi:hypothetical protein [Cytobacillus purgationiresistens]|uniref:Uncharacterized protein n=1 Tax=Cytobacillus purgationiresistens TaxID=863449 RepID=A0ABU0AKM6_9BACI|nr:hypothetical protein [Cytobacillus purgationiresistens]MDQ0271824.1 hypothetical protein [Cytobacillus purgationiresistens]
MSHYNVRLPLIEQMKRFRPHNEPGVLNCRFPANPPPSFVPVPIAEQSSHIIAQTAYRSLDCNTFICMKNGASFWFFPKDHNGQTISGWRWTKSKWIYFYTNIKKVKSIQCMSKKLKD